MSKLIALLFFSVTLLGCSGNRSENDQDDSDKTQEKDLNESITKVDSKTNTLEKKEELGSGQLRGVLQREIESLSTPFIDTLDQNAKFIDPQYDLELSNLSLRFVVFAARTNVIQKAEERTDIENKKLASTLRLKSAERQKKEYPALRSRYGKIMAATMWEHDVIIKVSGDDNSTISMTNSAFEQKSTVKDIYISLKDALIMYRFKKLIFRSYKGGEEIVIDLETPTDAELVLVNELQVK